MFSKLLGWMVLRARSDNSKEIEILYIRHQLAVLQRRTPRPQVGWTDRAVIAALARLLPVWRRHRMLVTPSTILRWHRQPAVTTAPSATRRALMRYDGEVVRHAGARASSALHLRPLIDAAVAIGFAATGRGPPTSCRTTKIAPRRSSTTRRAAEAGPHDSGVDVRPQLPKIAFMTMAGGLTTMEVERDTRLPSTRGGGRYAPRSGTRDPRPRRVGPRDEWRPQPSARLRAPRERHPRRRQPGDVYLGSA